jgi:serine/threonine protein kinase
VLVCREDAGGREVVVKLLCLAVHNEQQRLSMQSELLSAAAAAQHLCAVTAYDAGFTLDDRPFLVSRLCGGGSAQARLAAGGPLPVDEVLAIGLRLALALHASHRRGVLHLDVRPANILAAEPGDAPAEWLLADHGVARVLQRAAPQLGVVFDPMYAPRELFGWEPPGPPCDVYGLGATLYALLNGEPAYADAGRDGWASLYQEVLKGDLPRPRRDDLPGPLYGLLRSMMSASPEDRPPLTEVHRVLRELLGTSPAALSPYAPSGLSSRTAVAVPDLGPEPEPVDLLPGWDPALDAEIEAVPRPGTAGSRHGRRRITIVAAVAAVAVACAGVTWATVSRSVVPSPRASTPSASHPQNAVSTAPPSTPSADTPQQHTPPGPRTTQPAAPASPPVASHPAAGGAGGTGNAGSTGVSSGGSRSSGGAGAPTRGTASTPGPTPSPSAAPSCWSIGGGKYNCSVWQQAKSYNSAHQEVGVLNAGTNYFFCQANLGITETYGQYTNVWWAKTDDDRGNTNVYISDVYIQGGSNNARVPGLPIC